MGDINKENNNENKKWISKAVVGIAVCATITISVYITKNANCLFGLIFLPIIYVKMGD